MLLFWLYKAVSQTNWNRPSRLESRPATEYWPEPRVAVRHGGNSPRFSVASVPPISCSSPPDKTKKGAQNAWRLSVRLQREQRISAGQ